jgi:hypothetical protein
MNSACIASSLLIYLTYHAIQHESFALLVLSVLHLLNLSFPLVAIDADDDLLKWLMLFKNGQRVVVNVTIGPNDF